MRLEQCIPVVDFPLGEEQRNCRLRWFQCDSRESYQKRGGHPLYGEDAITYDLNRHGYRCADFDSQAQLRMLSVGCSVTLGVGLPQADLFHERLAERLRRELNCSIVNWNLGLSGASNDCLSRTLHLTVPRLDPDLVIVNFTYPGRREYFLVTNERFRYLPQDVPMNRTLTEVRQHFQKLSSPYDDEAVFFRSYKSIEGLLQGRNWLFSHAFVKPVECYNVFPHLDATRLVEEPAEVDKARDGIHPGPQSHELLAANYWQKLITSGALERLRQKLYPPPTAAEKAYQELIQDIQRVARTVVPRGATVVVCSRGDEELVRLEGLTAWHFPRDADGDFAGCYPADDHEAIALLETARAQGAQFWLLPSPAFWWLSHYTTLANYLAAIGQLCWLGPSCAIFALEKMPALPPTAGANGTYRVDREDAAAYSSRDGGR
jgi:hypothetical protein